MADTIVNLNSRPGVLIIIEVARELRCSKAHVHNLINGKVPETQPLPSLWLGRRRLVGRSRLEEWLSANEHRERCYDAFRSEFAASDARKEQRAKEAEPDTRIKEACAGNASPVTRSAAEIAFYSLPLWERYFHHTEAKGASRGGRAG